MKQQHKDAKSVTHSTDKATIDTTETGGSRLYAPGKPHEVESGPSRLQTSVLRSPRMGGTRKFGPTIPRLGTGIDTTESGPARIERYRK
jgi:hypothetical protein